MWELSFVIGFGNKNFELGFYIPNRPPIDDYPAQTDYRPLAIGELDHIVRHTSNHWRKIFNVYAKLLEALGWTQDWRQYRDNELLQPGCKAALLFDPPELMPLCSNKRIHLIAGKQYADQLTVDVEWIDERFALNSKTNVIVSPYLDYRQLSNERIERLALLIHKLKTKEPIENKG